MCKEKIECIDIFEGEEKREEFVKKCPECGKPQVYKYKCSFKEAVKDNVKCKECAYKQRKLYPKKGKSIWFKKCPDCKNPQYYSSKKTLAKSIKNNWPCKTCAGIKRTLPPEKRSSKRRKRDQKEYMKKYYKINKEEIQKKYKESQQKPEAREKVRKRYKKYMKNPLFRLNKNISSSIKVSLKSKRTNKNGRHWEDLVKYTIKELKEHLEKHFLPGMTWKNYNNSGWVIDHIIPRVFFNYTSTDDVEFLYCWSLNNLKPMWRKDNAEKGDKITIWGKEINARYMERDYFSKIGSFHTN